MNQKLHIFLRRVSSANQDLDTQKEFDRPFREACQKEQILIMNEDDTSANKLKTIQRPKIMDIIQLIKEGRVAKVYAYDRTRLFRDYYEAQYFCQICIEHKVAIVFTSTSNGHMEFTGDIFIEGILNLFGDIEGKNIARRTLEARLKYPPKKFGYIKTKQKKYQKAPETATILERFFDDIQHVDSVDILGSFLTEYRKGFAKGRTDESLIRMATDSFYAGYDLFEGEFQLPHVEPFLTKEVFLQIQEKLVPIIQAYQERTQQLQELNWSFPTCGYCMKPLRPRLSPDRSIAYLSCARKHNKVYYDTSTFNKATEEILRQVLNQLDTHMLLTDSQKKMKEIKKALQQEKDKTDTILKQIQNKILFSQTGYDQDWLKKRNIESSRTFKNVIKYVITNYLTNKGYL